MTDFNDVKDYATIKERIQRYVEDTGAHENSVTALLTQSNIAWDEVEKHFQTHGDSAAEAAQARLAPVLQEVDATVADVPSEEDIKAALKRGVEEAYEGMVRSMADYDNLDSDCVLEACREVGEFDAQVVLEGLQELLADLYSDADFLREGDVLHHYFEGGYMEEIFRAVERHYEPFVAEIIGEINQDNALEGYAETLNQLTYSLSQEAEARRESGEDLEISLEDLIKNYDDNATARNHDDFSYILEEVVGQEAEGELREVSEEAGFTVLD